MNKFHVLISIIVIGVLGILFVVSRFSSEEGITEENNSSLLNPLVTETFQDIDLASPSENQVLGQQNPQNMQGTMKPTVGVEDPIPATVNAVIKTSKGDIHLLLYGDDAAKTVRNFMNKANSGFYNNLTFHRVEGWVIQGGDPNGNGTGGGQMLTEINDRPFVTGSLGVARASNPQISNDAQFFITKSDASHLNEQYTNFGEVTDGMDVVNKIAIGDKILGIVIE